MEVNGGVRFQNAFYKKSHFMHTPLFFSCTLHTPLRWMITIETWILYSLMLSQLMMLRRIIWY